MKLKVRSDFGMMLTVLHVDGYDTSNVTADDLALCLDQPVSEGGIASSETVPELTEDDIPGAKLEEPLESYAVHALRRCHGIVVPTSWKKAKLVER